MQDWDQWLLQAQATNERDRRAYSHGVFVLMEEPEADEGQLRVAERPAEYGSDRRSVRTLAGR